MAKFTPGPWTAEPNYRSSGWFVVRPASAQRLAIVNERDAEIERDECEANARLIAAAPEMHVALEAIVGEAAFEGLPECKQEAIIAALSKAVT